MCLRGEQAKYYKIETEVEGAKRMNNLRMRIMQRDWRSIQEGRERAEIEKQWK